jgi:hypothetical protein
MNGPLYPWLESRCWTVLFICFVLSKNVPLTFCAFKTKLAKRMAQKHSIVGGNSIHLILKIYGRLLLLQYPEGKQKKLKINKSCCNLFPEIM